jgi:hypothetical protein
MGIDDFDDLLLAIALLFTAIGVLIVWLSITASSEADIWVASKGSNTG